MSVISPALTWTSAATGHVYNYIESLKTWDQANAYAQSIGGYLVTIDTIQENAEIYNNVYSVFSSADATLSSSPDGGSAAYLWLGGSDSALEGDWRWSHGNTSLEFMGSYLWGSGALGSEPDNAGNQDYLALGMENWPYGFEIGAGFGNARQWNDIGGANLLYFVVEFDPEPNLTTSSNADSVVGTSGDDAINSGAGNDSIWGNGGADSIDGGSGFDTVYLDGSALISSYDVATGVYSFRRDDGINDSVDFRNVEQINAFGSDLLLSEYNPSVYRFYNVETNSHFFTSSAGEATSVYNSLAQFHYEGVAFSHLGLYADNYDSVVNVHRFYNESTGTHFYTANEAEVTYVQNTYSNLLYEGVSYQAAGAQENPWDAPLYRFYNIETGAHFYTANEAEAENVRITYSGVFIDEGIAYYIVAS